MMKLVLHEDAARLGIRHPVACLIHHVEVVPGPANALAGDIAQLMDRLAQEGDHLAERREVQGYRTLFERLGYPRQVPAGERLVESFRKRGFRSINNVVDACNIASATACAGLGLHDGRRVLSDVHVRCAAGTERIRPLFRAEQAAIPAGDLIYDCDGAVLAWLGKRDVDSDDFKIGEATRTAILLALGNEQTDEAHGRDVCLHALDLIRKTCRQARGQLVQIEAR
ncbi:phenylalanine--tRNA ligase beta subunit-related protein [Sorangium sp. So ce726]|uniref:phenylalanine--tRNA ligase beta subunit-related protein n=1 Tax=Sorangium sp. So ce726 TaxID=3133319 RepID=UPI003F5D93F6